MALVEKKSFCRICGSGCGIIVELEEERVVRVRADVEHPVSRGYTCPKGRALTEDHNRDDAMDVPMLRVDGVLQPSTWEVVLDDLAAKLSQIVAETGPRGIGTFIGGGGFLDASGFSSLIAFMRGIGSPSLYSDLTIDSVAKVCASEMVAGISIDSRADLERSKLVIFIGTNPVISHARTLQMHSPTAAMRDMRGHGAELWVIDPRRSETAQRADRHIGARPGTDYAILGYLIRELLQDGADWEYIRAHAQGPEKLAAAVERFTLDRAAAIAGVPEADLTDLLASVRRAGRLSVETGTGVTMQRAGNVTQWLCLALMIVTGSLDREGGSWINRGRINRRDRVDPPPAPETGWDRPGPASRPELRGTGGDFPCAAIPDEVAARNLRAMAVFGGNLEPCLPDTARSYAALKDLDVLAVLDVRHTRTGDIATHILPTKHQLERADLNFITDTAYPILASQYTPAMVATRGDRRAFWWVFGEIGRRMGIDFFPGFDHTTATDDTYLEYLLAKSEVDFDELKEKVLITEPPHYGWVQRYVDEHVGGWRMAPSPLVEQLDALIPSEEERASRPLVLIPRRQKFHENSKLLELRDKPWVFMNSQDARASGIEEGAPVEIRSVNGRLRMLAKFDDTLRAGAINIPHGWSDEHNVNRLTGTQDVDPITGMVVYSGLEVSVEPA